VRFGAIESSERYRAPASLDQRRMWAAHERAADAPLNVVSAWRVAGPLDADVLARAVAAAAAAHDVLCSRFESVGGELLQVVHEAPPRWPVRLAPRPPSVGVAAHVEQVLAEEAGHVFQLGRGPLLRVAVAELAPDDRLLSIVAHRTLLDEWSGGLLAEALSTAYAAIRDGADPAVERPAIQYAAFAEWERHTQGSPALVDDLAFWSGRLRQPLPTLRLPDDRPRAAAPSLRAGRAATALPAPLTARLEAFARRQRTMPAVVLLASLHALLHRWTGASDVVVGAAVAGRPQAELARTIGPLGEVLPIRVEVDPRASFERLVEAVGDRMAEALAHRPVPPEHARAVQAIVAQPAPAAPLRLAQADVVEVETAAPATPYHLALRTETQPRAGEPLRCAWDYRADLLAPHTVEDLAASFETLLAAALADPSAPLGGLPSLTPRQRERVRRWGRGPDPPPTTLRLHELVARQATATPTAPAVVAGDRTLTYGELHRRAAGLAPALGASAGPGARVGVLLPRSAELVVAILAVLEAGAAYVPLDPAYPPDRIACMLEDSEPVAVVADATTAAQVPAGVRVVDVGAGEAAAAPRGAGDRARPGPDDPAYVIYTSGSTGAPKGVVVGHANAVASTLARVGEYPGGGPRAFLSLSSFSFDSSVAGLFWTLATGGALVLGPAGAELDLHDVEALVERHGVTHTLLTPGLHAVLLGNVPETVRRLRTVIVAGEACPQSLVDLHLRVAPDTRLYNEYGPTEAAVWCAVADLSATRAGAVPTIGRPIAGARLRVVDERLQPVPPGVAGELLIGGAGVALGYWRREDLTAERFVEAGDDGGRTYRTGDVVRWTAEGQLEFLGRRDSQVKVRGYRVELGEVEALVGAHPHVGDVCVDVRAVGGERELVAYVVWSGGDGGVARELRAFVRERAPVHLAPGRVVVVGELPRSPNGKVDRSALPDPR